MRKEGENTVFPELKAVTNRPQPEVDSLPLSRLISSIGNLQEKLGNNLNSLKPKVINRLAQISFQEKRIFYSELSCLLSKQQELTISLLREEKTQ